jgi:anaerobic dimethyl sulfoxide reductase subunit B (iron-sulfur subunit)
MTYGTVADLTEKLAAKPKQVLWVPQFKPLSAKGKFVSTNEKRHRAAAIDVKAVEHFENTVHRADDRVELVDIKKVDGK